jgi:hypothetical protein
MTGERTNVQVFKARAAVLRFARVFPGFLAAAVALWLLACAIAWWLNAWLMPVFMLFPLLSALVGYWYLRQMATLQIVVLADRLRVTQGNQTTLDAAWQQMSRLTVRTGKNGPIYEIWLKNAPIVVPVGFVERGPELMTLVAQRSRRAWESL